MVVNRPRTLSTPDIFLVLIRRPHSLDNLLTPGLFHVSVLGNQLPEQCVDLACHVGGITTDVEVRLLFKELVDFFAILLKLVLNVDLLWAVTGESCVHDKIVSECFFVFLGEMSAWS